MPVTEEMYSCIEAERTRNRFTIADFAAKIGVSEKTYRNWRDESKPVSDDVLLKISEVFHCSVDYLLHPSDKIRR